jgi:hypothetical protein
MAYRWDVLKRRGDSLALWVRVGSMALAVVLAAVVTVWSMVWLRSVSPHGPGPVLVEPVFRPAATPTEAQPVPELPAPKLTPPVRRPSPSRSRPAKATTRPAPPVPAKTATKPAPPPPIVIAFYSLGASWDTGFIGSVRLQNTGSTPQNWTVVVRYDSADGVRVGQAWNGEATRQGDTTIFRGGPLAPGATKNLGFEATKRTPDRVLPASCTVNGSACR